MTQRRDEPAMNIIGSIAPVLSVLPTAVLEGITGSVIGSDVQASNVPVYPGDTYLAGAKILRQYGIGPLPGVAMMVVLISGAGGAPSRCATTGRRCETTSCSLNACRRVSTKSLRWPVVRHRVCCRRRSILKEPVQCLDRCRAHERR